MLKLPKIDEEYQPLKSQYRDTVKSKFNIKGNRKKSQPKFDWIGCQMNIVQSFSNQKIIKQLIQFQHACKSNQIPSFYSYFFLKSLFGNNSIELQRQFLLQNTQNIVEKPIKQILLPIQMQKYILENLSKQEKKITTHSSNFQNIQSFIKLREDLFLQMENNYKEDAHNRMQENVNDIRFINFQIVDLVQKWKQQIKQIQQNTSKFNTLKPNSILFQPIFFYKDQNYLSKMIYDNANLINIINKKTKKFISPPNPFFISNDGNKQGMSTKQQLQIEEAMQFMAKQKALQLKMFINPPQYVIRQNMNKKQENQSSSERILTGKIKSKDNNQRIKSIQNIYKTQNKRNSYKFDKEQDTQNLSRYQPVTQIDKKDRSNSLKKLVVESNDRRQKFQQLIKSKQIQMLRSLNKKQKQSVLDNKLIATKYASQKIQPQQSPLKTKLSKLREQVQNNISPKKQLQLKESIITNKSFRQTFTLIDKVKTTKPKMKIVTQRQTVVTNLVNPILQLFGNKIQSKQQSKEKSLSKSKQKQQIKFSSTFYKNQKDINYNSSPSKKVSLKASRVSSAKKIKLQPLKNQSPIKISKRVEVLDKNSKTSTNFLYSKHKLSSDISEYLSNKKVQKKQAVQNSPFEIKNPITSRRTKHQRNDQSIEQQLKNLKSRVRTLDIWDIYGKKQKSPHRNITNSRINKQISNSRITKQYSLHQVYSRKGRKSQAIDLQHRIDDLLEKQQKDKIFNHSIHQIDQKANQIIQKDNQLNQYNTVNLGQLQKSRFKNDMKSLGTQQISVFDQNIKKLKKKKHLIEQSNQFKTKQILQNKKNKQKFSSQINQKQKRLKQLQQKISIMKNNRKQKVFKNVQDFKVASNRLAQSTQLLSQISPQLQKIKQKQLNIIKANQQIQSKMKQQQKRFIQLKQKEYKLRQQSVLNKHLQDLKVMKQKYTQKQIQYQKRILQQQRRRKQHQIQLIQQRRQTQQMKLKLHQQQLKQQLLKQILQKQAQKQKHFQQQTKQAHIQFKSIIQKQLIQKQQYEMKLYQTYQKQNATMLQAMNQMIQRNKKITEANLRKMQQVQAIRKQKQEEQIKFEQLQKQVKQMQQTHQIQPITLISHNQSISNIKLTNTTQQTHLQTKQQIQDLKMRLKSQILHQIIKRRKQQEQQQRIFQQQRKKRMKQLQTQVKQLLRKQDQQLKQIQQKQLKRAHQINQLNHDQSIKYRINQTSKLKIKSQLKNTLQANVNDSIANSIQLKPANQKDNKNQNHIQYKQQNNKQSQIKIQLQYKHKQTQIHQQKSIKLRDKSFEKQIFTTQKSIIVNQDLVIDNKSKMIDNKVKMQSPNTIETIQQPVSQKATNSLVQYQQITSNNTKQSIQKQKQVKQKQKQSLQKPVVKAMNEQINERYVTLKQSFNLKAKQIIINESQTQVFLKQFYNNYPIEVRSMLPYKQNEMVLIFKSHKYNIDLYDCHALGWYDQDTQKYFLMGAVDPIHLIVRKYGHLQIQIIYIFDKQNLAQKQFLVKQIKFFQKVGYVFQKKLKDSENLFSIKFIIKIPKQQISANKLIPNQLLNITVETCLNNNQSLLNQSKSIQLQKRKHIFSQLLTQTILKNYSQEQLKQLYLFQDKSIEMKLLIQKIKSIKEAGKSQNSKNHKNNFQSILCQYLILKKQNSSKLNFNFKIPYIQLSNQLFFSFKETKQYNLSSGQIVYVANNDLNSNGLKILIMELDKSNVQRFYLDTYLKPKITQLQQLKESNNLQLLLPSFNLNTKFGFKDTQKQEYCVNFTYQINVKSDVIMSSISTDKLITNQSRKIIKLDKQNHNICFLFAICSCQNNVISKLISGMLVTYEDVQKMQ